MPPAPLPEASLLASILKRCTAATSLREARQLHALLLTSNTDFSNSVFLHNNIISMYSRCGSFRDSQHVFDEMPQRNIVSYNALISAYSRSPHHAHLSFQLFDQLRSERLVPNGLTITSLLQAAAELEDWILGSSLHSRCFKMGFWNNVRVQTSLLGMYSNCGDVDCAKNVFKFMIHKDSTASNAIISGCVKNGELEEGVDIFRNMLKNGISPTQFTYSMVLNISAKIRDYDYGKLTHAHLLVSGTLLDLPLQNSLLDMYCSCGDTHTAYNVFSRIQKPDIVSWNSMIFGYSENGEGDQAMDMFVHLMRVSSLNPDEYTFAAVISCTDGFPSSHYGKPFHAQTEKRGFSRSVYIGSTLISMYFNNDDPVSSQKIFDSFSNKDAVLWTNMISGYVRISESEAAMKLFHELFQKGCDNVDSFALSSALSACADLATLRQGEMIHCLVLKMGIDSENCVHGSLVDTYAKNGELKSATYIFSCLPMRDLKCWNSLLTGYGNHGKAKEAFQIFYAMLKHGLRPDHVTFLSILSTCSNCGLVGKSRFFWNYMKENSLGPGPKHYSCMISLLSRAGLWDEAEEMISESPFVDDYLESWRTILSSCIKNGNFRTGVRAAEQILNINAEDSAANILLTKLYAATGRWEEVSKTRRKMRKLMMEKDPGLSWIEVGNNVHVFSSGDQTHLQNDEIKVVLNELLGSLMPAVENDNSVVLKFCPV